MSTKQVGGVLHHFRRFLLDMRGGMTDRELLDAFIAQRDEAFFEALVQRHGRMVWGVCRRLLHNHEDAEDAFQAVFLVLLRKAETIVSREVVGSWLYSVAYQTARNARATSGKRKQRERQLPDLPAPVQPPVPMRDELRLLDQELCRLPANYRSVIVLCELQGQTRKDAAKQLDVPEGTVAGWLARAKALLAKRMMRHGVAFTSVAVTSLLADTAACGAAPRLATAATIKGAGLLATGQSASGVVSTHSLILSKAVLTSMFLTKCKTIAMAVLTPMLCLCLIAGIIHSSGFFTDADISPLFDFMFAAEPLPDQPDKKASDSPNDAQPKEPPKNFTNRLGMKFVWIPPGTYLMGSTKDEKLRNKDDKFDEDQHKVTLTKGFYMAVFPVTQEEWQAVMGDNNPSKFREEKNLPVEYVSWNDCQEFIKKLCEIDGKAYRLPTEAEWEYACRAETTTPFHFGEKISTDQVNFEGGGGSWYESKEGINRKKTVPVDTFPANAWGLYGMHGNVLQFCQDWHGAYSLDDAIDPQGPERGEHRVLRGGSWFAGPQHCRSACRQGDYPDERRDDSGFRICFFLE